jgi:hypothetical protein
VDEHVWLIDALGGSNTRRDLRRRVRRYVLKLSFFDV